MAIAGTPSHFKGQTFSPATLSRHQFEEEPPPPDSSAGTLDIWFLAFCLVLFWWIDIDENGPRPNSSVFHTSRCFPRIPRIPVVSFLSNTFIAHRIGRIRFKISCKEGVASSTTWMLPGPLASQHLSQWIFEGDQISQEQIWAQRDFGYGYLWISMDICGYLWISMDIYMDIYGYLWISIWISVDIYGYLWISMDIYGYLWISMDIYGYLWISMDIYGYLWISIDQQPGTLCLCHVVSRHWRLRQEQSHIIPAFSAVDSASPFSAKANAFTSRPWWLRNPLNMGIQPAFYRLVQHVNYGFHRISLINESMMVGWRWVRRLLV